MIEDKQISVKALISWLEDQKYNNIDETNENMTEAFEEGCDPLNASIGGINGFNYFIGLEEDEED